MIHRPLCMRCSFVAVVQRCIISYTALCHGWRLRASASGAIVSAVSQCQVTYEHLISSHLNLNLNLTLNLNLNLNLIYLIYLIYISYISHISLISLSYLISYLISSRISSHLVSHLISSRISYLVSRISWDQSSLATVISSATNVIINMLALRKLLSIKCVMWLLDV